MSLQGKVQSLNKKKISKSVHVYSGIPLSSHLHLMHSCDPTATGEAAVSKRKSGKQKEMVVIQKFDSWSHFQQALGTNPKIPSLFSHSHSLETLFRERRKMYKGRGKRESGLLYWVE
jgi:hypothetical protein